MPIMSEKRPRKTALLYQPLRGWKRHLSRTLVIAAAFVGLGLGWKTFWFLCDDAYIVFRYVSNHQLGWGYTWNPPPFQPVEGYTNFLWMALLDGVWTLLGVEPPDAANWLSLMFAAGTLALVMALAWRLPLAERLERYRIPIVALVLLGTLSNRTFLTWTSSGLGTSLFTFLVFCFVAACFALPDGRGRITAIVLSASLMALCRPDGLLYIAFSGAIYLLHLRHPRRHLQWRDFACILPVVIPIAHLLWHRASYGYWLPNTYYAKHAGAWPEAGVRYLASFVLEYALWVWVGVAAAAAIRNRNRLLLILRDPRGATLTLALLALVGHFSYYTFVIGGDHFEYRIYHHIVPLLWLSLPWLISRLELAPWRSIGLVCIAIALSWPIPWTHWRHTHDFTNLAQTFKMRYAVAPKLPAFAP